MWSVSKGESSLGETHSTGIVWAISESGRCFVESWWPCEWFFLEMDHTIPVETFYLLLNHNFNTHVRQDIILGILAPAHITWRKGKLPWDVLSKFLIHGTGNKWNSSFINPLSFWLLCYKRIDDQNILTRF